MSTLGMVIASGVVSAGGLLEEYLCRRYPNESFGHWVHPLAVAGQSGCSARALKYVLSVEHALFTPAQYVLDYAILNAVVHRAIMYMGPPKLQQFYQKIDAVVGAMFKVIGTFVLTAWVHSTCGFTAAVLFGATHAAGSYAVQTVVPRLGPKAVVDDSRAFSRWLFSLGL